jgi:hypothetical protein
MKTDRPLHLYEQLLLLTLDSRRGTPVLAFAQLAVAVAVSIAVNSVVIG